ncbi:MAG: hypothetical protein ACI93R_000909 [Flavobacteriales bacterium]
MWVQYCLLRQKCCDGNIDTVPLVSNRKYLSVRNRRFIKKFYPYCFISLFAVFHTILFTDIARAERTFIHPGATNTLENLSFVKEKITSGEQPWTNEYHRIKHSKYTTRTAHALTTVNSKNNEAFQSRDDALAAYTQALLWHLSGEINYADSSISILNSWSGLRGFSSGTGQDKLQAAWLGAIFACAAELMRDYPGWKKDDIEKLQAMFKHTFYPQLNHMSHWNGNVDLTQIEAILAIAVFNDDEQELQLGLKRFEQRIPAYFYLTSDGPLPIAINNDERNIKVFWSTPTQWIDGLSQESCRDNGHHSQFALGSAIHAAEIAWNQGIDIYTKHQTRLVMAMELLAQQLLNNNFSSCQNTTATKNRFNTWEMGFNHFAHRKGLKLPFTAKLIHKQIRPSSTRAAWNLAYETLTHADIDKPALSQQ